MIRSLLNFLIALMLGALMIAIIGAAVEQLGYCP